MKNPLFEGLNEEEEQSFLSIFAKKEIPKGQAIKKEGDHLKKGFLLESGLLLVKKHSSDGEMEVATISDSSVFFSLTCLVDGGNSLTTVEAKKDSVILEVSQKDFFAFCQKNPEIGVKVLKNATLLLAKFLRNSDEKIVQMYKTLEEVL
ncbi:Crp/Fnr family transcriptional regulator [Nitratiruptor sp. YY09-18]|uniref:Crp/Fnr family transcriptional regulator n=1 Tax=Nitratiruptor sp. YY09-18 TaxID=2724901 RepID=UPI001915CAE0|nr:Crp/Fnr family transcriptional regulator [Nitratiruptor sp. YY09-18]BCD67231.1 transcriptional regulator, Crp/Fnr family [Nitratiruptor sp. YY09-18]